MGRKEANIQTTGLGISQVINRWQGATPVNDIE